jgi:hypothetical protein
VYYFRRLETRGKSIEQIDKELADRAGSIDSESSTGIILNTMYATSTRSGLATGR